MNRRRQRQCGSSILYVVLLSPVLMLTMAFAVDLGAMQLQRQRLSSAVDQAVVVAADRAAAGGTAAGLDRSTAETMVRIALLDNLAPLAGQMRGATPSDIAATADVAVITALPTEDPFAPGTWLRSPTVETRVRVPVDTGLLAAAGLPDIEYLTLTARSQLRVAGA